MSTRTERRRRTMGQTMVLGCVTLLTMALMLMLSFNLTNAIHEKMRLQTHSDAIAYSIATIEARSFNYFAYTNRAEAAAYVTMCTLHAYMASISLIPSILTAGEIAFFEIMGEEFAQCCECQPFCCAVIHCFHAIQAMMIAFQYMNKSSDMGNKVGGYDSKFNDAIDNMQQMVNLIHIDQFMAALNTGMQFSMGTGLKDTLGKTNAKYATDLTQGVGAINMVNYACGMEGSPLDQECSGAGTGNSQSPSSKENRSRVMADVANAARPGFDTSGPPVAPLQFLGTDWFINGNGYMNLQNNDGSAIPLMTSWKTGVTEGSVCDPQSLNKGTMICAKQEGFFIAQWQDGVGVMTFSADVASDKNGGQHDPSSAHQQNHDKFTGIQSEDGMGCIMKGDCFINFRAVDNKDPDTDFGQPSAFGHVGQSLRVRARTDAFNPWEINQKHTMNWDDGARGQATLNFGPRQDGKAVSKAKVYFHRFDSWQFGPTMFDPYWRSKLHPFTSKTEVGKVLGAASDTDGATIAESAGIEGNDQLP